MNFGVVDGRVFPISDAPRILNKEGIFSQMGRIVTDLDQVVGDVVVATDPNLSLIA